MGVRTGDAIVLLSTSCKSIARFELWAPNCSLSSAFLHPSLRPFVPFAHSSIHLPLSHPMPLRFASLLWRARFSFLCVCVLLCNTHITASRKHRRCRRMLWRFASKYDAIAIPPCVNDNTEWRFFFLHSYAPMIENAIDARIQRNIRAIRDSFPFDECAHAHPSFVHTHTDDPRPSFAHHSLHTHSCS